MGGLIDLEDSVCYNIKTMTTITIPKKEHKEGELIAIPRKEYENYLEIRKLIPIVKMSPAEKREWIRAKNDYLTGKYITFGKFKRELGSTTKRKGQ